MEIKVIVQSVYGRNMIYPACDKSRAFAVIAGSKTLTLDVIDQIKKLGYTIEITQPTITL